MSELKEQKILFLTDLKTDDNIAFINLIKILKEKNINFKIDVIITNIKNINKMLKNLLDHGNNYIDELYKNNKIMFYEGISTNKKRHESIISDSLDNFNINILKLNNFKKDNKYSFGFIFAPFNELDLECNFEILLIGFGYNTEIIGKNGKIEIKKTINYLEKFCKKSEKSIFMNNIATFNIDKEGNEINPKERKSGKLNKNNKLLDNLLKNTNNGKEFINQGIIENKVFVRDQLYKVIKGSENIEILKKSILKYGFKYNDVNLINKIDEFLDKKEEDIVKMIKEIKNTIDENKLINYINFKYFYLIKILDNIKNKHEIEVTDWSQMVLFWKMYNDDFKKNTKKLKLYDNGSFIEFKENIDKNGEDNEILFACNFCWVKLFN